MSDKIKILLVEDEETLAMIIKRYVASDRQTNILPYYISPHGPPSMMWSKDLNSVLTIT